MAGYRALLSDPLQRRLLVASIPADFADWLDYVAIVSVLIYVWHEGPLTMAFFALALTLPYVVAGPLLAAAIDRADLKHALILSNLGRAAATLGLIVAPNTAVLLLLVFVRGCIDSAFTPARQSAIQLITPPELLMSANGAHQSVNQISKIAGPATGGLLLTLLPAGGIFAVNALLSLVAAAILLGIRLPGRPRPERKALGIRHELGAGLAVFAGNCRLLAALVVSATAYFAVFLYDALLALLANGFGLDATIFGLSVAASGAGGLAGALIGGALPSTRPFVLMGLGGLIGAPISIGVGLAGLTGFAMPAWVFLAAMAVAGGSFAFMLVPYRTIVQEEAPPDRIARVFAAGEAVTMAVMLSGPFIGSAIAAAAGVGAAFVAGGVLFFLVGLGAVIYGARP